jgi:hypothetical protein
LETCSDLNCALINLEKEETPEVLKTLQKIPLIAGMGYNLLRMYCLPAIETKYIGQKINKNLIRINFTIFLIDIKIIYDYKLM